MFYELPIVTLKTPTVCLQQNSIGRRPKDFEASGFPSRVFNNTHFFKNQSQKSKKFHIRKSGDVQQTKWQKQKVLFYYEDFVYQAFEL